MHSVRTDLVLRLHTDADGLVWYGDDASPAVNSCLDAGDFFDSESHCEELDNARVVRLLGTRDNAQLVVKLQERRVGNPQFSAKPIRIGSPAAVPAKWLKGDPSAVLHHLWQPPYAASLVDHWHDMTPADYTTYAMISLLDGCRGREVPEVVRRVAAHHPAWPAVTFVRGVDEDAACRMLADVVDPRWYRHPTRPNRFSRLYSHLGVTPENMAACSGSGRSGLHFNRATNAVRVWYNRAAHACRHGDACDFLSSALASGNGDLARGLLVGTKRMVALVASVWLEAVRPQHPEAGFDASRFFRDQATLRAFSQHRASGRRV